MNEFRIRGNKMNSPIDKLDEGEIEKKLSKKIPTKTRILTNEEIKRVQHALKEISEELGDIARELRRLK